MIIGGWSAGEGRRGRDVKGVLRDEFGVDPATIETVGLGSSFKEYQPDNDPNGNLLSAQAQLNRTVRIDPCTPACPSHAVE